MAIKIGSNITSYSVQRRLGEAAERVSKTFERLSSGQRVNRASDDTAGLAIAEGLKTKKLVFGQAVRNVNDGISLFSIAEGAIGELKNIVLRQRELAAQAANGTYSVQQRTALDKERITLEEEYNRIIKSTSFNGRKIFDESQGPIVLQAGYGVSGSIQTAADSSVDYASAITRISTDSSGKQGTSLDPMGNYHFNVSADSRYVFFSSCATDLVSGDTNNSDDVFVKDLLTGQTTRVSTTSSGAQANSHSSHETLSADGRYVAFSSSATNLVSGDTNGQSDVFVKDLWSGEVKQASTNASGTQVLSAGADATGISADGRYVLFETTASNLVSGDNGAGSNDLFLKDMLTGELKRVSSTPAGTAGSSGVYNSTLSQDGRYALFASDASDLVSGDTNGIWDVFLKDLETGELKRVNTNGAGGQTSGNDSTPVGLSADGRYVYFSSGATNLVSGDTNNSFDIFSKDLLSGEVKRLSTDRFGNQTASSTYDARVSSDGRFLTFLSYATNLVSGDTNGDLDAFIKDLSTGDIRRLNVDSAGNQTLGDEPKTPVLSTDGRYFFFISMAGSLVSGDTNALQDIFMVANPFAERYTLNLEYGISIQTRSGALYMQSYLDRQLNDLNNFQGQLGAIQQRLGTATNVLSAMQDNLAAAAGRIIDADVAEESANLMRNQIAQNSATAILAQANQQPQLALQLLRNV